MISKTFKYTELVEKKVIKTLPVFESGTMLKVVTPYGNFKMDEIIIVHSSHYGKFNIQDNIYYEVTWFFISEQGKKTITSVVRDVTLWENYFEECTLKDLQKYIKANNGE